MSEEVIITRKAANEIIEALKSFEGKTLTISVDPKEFARVLVEILKSRK